MIFVIPQVLISMFESSKKKKDIRSSIKQEVFHTLILHKQKLINRIFYKCGYLDYETRQWKRSTKGPIIHFSVKHYRNIVTNENIWIVYYAKPFFFKHETNKKMIEL